MLGLFERPISNSQMMEPSTHPTEEMSIYREPDGAVHQFPRDASLRVFKVGAHVLLHHVHELICSASQQS